MFDLKLYSNSAEIKAKWAGPMTIFFPTKLSFQYIISIFQTMIKILIVCFGQLGWTKTRNIIDSL